MMTDPGLWALIDFAVLAFALVKLGGPAIGRVFSGKRQAIAQAVASAERALAEAQSTLAEQRRTESDAAAILADIGAGARTMAQTLVADFERETQAELKRAQQAALAEIDRERQAMLTSVRAEIVAAAFAAAESSLRDSLRAGQRQRELFAAFATRAMEIQP